MEENEDDSDFDSPIVPEKVNNSRKRTKNRVRTPYDVLKLLPSLGMYFFSFIN